MDRNETMRYIRPMSREDPYNTKINKIFTLYDLIETKQVIAQPRQVSKTIRSVTIDPQTFQVDDSIAVVNSFVGKKTV